MLRNLRETHFTSGSSVDTVGDRRSDTARLGEHAAASHLQGRGYRVLERNYRTRFGEIDLVALDGTTLVFCEVKTLVARSTAGRGPTHPLEGVPPAKRTQVRRIAREWLAERRENSASPRYRDIRFDAVGVLVSAGGTLLSLEHVASAF